MRYPSWSAKSLDSTSWNGGISCSCCKSAIGRLNIDLTRLCAMPFLFSWYARRLLHFQQESIFKIKISFFFVGCSLGLLRLALARLGAARLHSDLVSWCAARLRPNLRPWTSRVINDAHFMQKRLLQLLHKAVNAPWENSLAQAKHTEATSISANHDGCCSHQQSSHRKDAFALLNPREYITLW